MVNSTWATKAEWAVGEDLGSDHLPITIAISCQVPNTSVTRRRARWNTTDVNWQGFAAAVDTAIAAYPPEPISLRDRVLRLNNTSKKQAARNLQLLQPVWDSWSKPRTSCDNRSAPDDPCGDTEARSRSMQHDDLDAPCRSPSPTRKPLD